SSDISFAAYLTAENRPEKKLLANRYIGKLLDFIAEQRAYELLYPGQKGSYNTGGRLKMSFYFYRYIATGAVYIRLLAGLFADKQAALTAKELLEKYNIKVYKKPLFVSDLR
ncbi:MAG TPA: hypothetical protein VKS21_11510, partial [Spirochaetota bacterium]|nr:hypothetical protein [Spirochaetota bacterium]